MEPDHKRGEMRRMLSPGTPRDCDSVNSQESVQSDTIVAPPDGGWGWIIVFAAFMCAFVIDGVTNSFGVFYVEFLDYYQSDKAITALAGSLVCGCFLTFGAISGPLVTRFGCRLVAFVGGIVTSAALIICTFSPNIQIFLFTYGCLAGIGLGLVYVPSILIVNFYFDKKRGVASGIVTSGAGVGVVVMAKLSECLLKEYGWKGAHIVIAGVALNLCVCASLFRPLTLTRPVLPSEPRWEVDEVVVVVEEEKLPQSPLVSRTSPWSPGPSPRSQAINNCLQSGKYTSLPIVDQTDKSSCRPAFNPSPPLVPSSTMAAGKMTWRSTEWLTRLKGSDNAPDRLYASMFAVNTPPISEPRTSAKKTTKVVSMSPLVRKDIFFSGSVTSLEQFKSQPDMKHYIASITVQEENGLHSQEETVRKTCCKNLCSNIDLSLFKSMIFNIFCVTAMLIQLAAFIPPFYLSNYAVSVGLEASSVSTFLACIGFSCIIGRLLSGALSSWKPDQCLNIMAVSLTLTGLACALFPACQTFLQICVMSSVYGFLLGFFPPIQPILLVQYLGLEKLSASFGLSTGLKGLATMAGPPMAGVILECTGTFVAPFCFGGVCLAMAGLLHWVVPFLERPPGRGMTLEVEAVNSHDSDSGSQTEESLVDSVEDRKANAEASQN